MTPGLAWFLLTTVGVLAVATFAYVCGRRDGIDHSASVILAKGLCAPCLTCLVSAALDKSEKKP